MEKLVLKNFRKFTYLELELNKFNILVGRNNSGKTTILEAFAIVTSSPYLTDFLQSSIFIPILINRQAPYYLEFINIDSDSAEITLGNKKVTFYKSLDNETLKKRISEDKEKENVFQLIDALKYFLSIVSKKPQLPTFTNYSSIYAVAEDGEKKIAHYIEVETENMSVFKHISEMDTLPASFSYFITDKVFISNTYLTYLINYMTLQNYSLYSDILTKFKEYMKPYDIEDVRVINNNVYVVIKGKPIPISQIGAGARSALIRQFLYSQGRYLAIDTPENDLHPGLLSITLERLSDNATVILSTQSLDVIDSILSIFAERKRLKDLTIFVLDENGVKEKIKGKSAFNRVKDIGEDLRGY